MRVFGIGKVAAVGLAAAAALMFTPTTTMAAGAVPGVVEGSGTISPPLTATPQAVTGGFTGTAVGAGVIGTTPTVVNDTCTFTFASSPPGDSIATGQGTASGSCTGTAAITASLNYTRVGAAVAITGTGTINGSATTVTTVCVFVATSNPPGTFILVCVTVIDP